MWCPTKDDLTPQALALLPRGRAWATHESGPGPETTLFRYWSAVCDVFAYVCQRLCALRQEFWCSTHSETRDLWLAEYGLPDECDPYPDLCAKVAAYGGARCEDYVALAARAGWDIECIDVNSTCGDPAGGAVAGSMVPGVSLPAGKIVFRVFPQTSPAFVATYDTGPFAGSLQPGVMLDCEPDISGLACVLERVIHAHVRTEYHIA